MHFLDFVLEALEGGKLAGVNDHIVAQQAYAGATFHNPFGNTATSNLANLGNIENFKNFGVADEGFTDLWV